MTVKSDKAYGWFEGGKYRVSKLPPGATHSPTTGHRAANVYDDMAAALADAAARGIQIEWADGTE